MRFRPRHLLGFLFALASSGIDARAEPFGAEDYGAQSHSPSIPEPLVFDMVRGLGARKGEFEVNTLAEFPWGGKNDAAPENFDPFGSPASSVDTDGVEWAPEVEIAIADGLAIEFEFPFEDGEQESYKFAGQWTLGTAHDNQFIHGLQTIIEPDIEFEEWETTFLYIAGMQFDERFSALGMVGVRPLIEEGHGFQEVDGLINLTLFADMTSRCTVGLESNFSFGDSDRTSLLLMPQVDFEVTDHFQIQAGVGPGFSAEGTEGIAALRVIYSR